MKLADEKGFVTVLPFGQYNNRGLNSWNTVNDPDGVDDVQFVQDIIDGLSKRLSINPQRIYATGMSGGACMAGGLACELDDALAAVAPVAGIQFPSDCQASRAVPIITFHGKEEVKNV
jgi:polyhydroxybutyrate depolymerase